MNKTLPKVCSTRTHTHTRTNTRLHSQGARVFAINVANLPPGTIFAEADSDCDAEGVRESAADEAIGGGVDEGALRAMAADGRWADVVQVLGASVTADRLSKLRAGASRRR